MKKKTRANLIMTGLILLIITAAILGVGYIQGWFDTTDGSQAVLQSTRGVVQLMREGISYPAGSDTVLRSGDKLTCQNGATATIVIGSDRVILGESASLSVTEPSAGHFEAEIFRGELFIHCDGAAAFSFSGKKISVKSATAWMQIKDDTQSVGVLRGTVENVAAGHILLYQGAEMSVEELTLKSLNDFVIAQIRSFNDPTLCFTAADLDRLASDRRQEIQELINNQTEPIASAPTEPPSAEETAPPPDTPDATAPPSTDITVPVTTQPPVEETEPPEPTVPPVTQSCTISIYCSTILDNFEDLEPGKAEFVPSDGVILYPVTVSFTDGETVFDVLKRVCEIVGIQLEYSWTPLYNSYYVEGIHNLYEFDCGFESGWMYKVNGWFPNYGCSSYTLKDGDVIVWTYTCQGLGTDVGAPRMERAYE